MAMPKGRRLREDRKDVQVYEPGVQGRKTGITLPQNARDEHGIEDLDGIFSSPEKPAPQRSPRRQDGNKTLTSSSIEMAQSRSTQHRIDSTQDADVSDNEGSAPDPTEVLSTRRVTLKSSKSTFPPPAGVSPYKTNIGSSPRRQSSVKPRRSGTPELLKPRPTVTRRLDFTEDESSTLRRPAKRKSTAAVAEKKDVYALEATEEESIGRLTEELELPLPEDESVQFVEEDDGYNDGYDDAPALEEPSEPEQISSPSRHRASRNSQSQLEEEEASLEPELEPAAKRKKSRLVSRRSLATEDDEATAQSSKATQKAVPRAHGKAPLRSTKTAAPVDSSPVSVDDSLVSQPLPKAAAKGKGKRRSRQLPTPEDTQPTPDDPVETTEIDDSMIVDSAPKQGPKPGLRGKRKLEVYDESEVPAVDEATELVPGDQPPTKKTRGAPKKTAALKKAAKVKAPKEREANISFAKPALPTHVNGSGTRWDESKWSSSRNMSRLRDPTPCAEAVVGRTRSGRQVIKPLNHFANERASYGRDGTLLAVQTAETVEKETSGGARRGQSRAPAGARRGASRARGVQETIMEEEEEEIEEWEARGEMIYGEVNGYDALTGATLTEAFETELAWSPDSIPLRPVSSANFGFAKLLNLPFFGSGIMDFPVGGFKKPRNSGKTTLHVFVHTGRVWVRIGGGKVNRFGSSERDGTEFVVGVGGSFHVPRGNLYEIKNVANKSARLFFAQGTEMVVAE